MGFRQIAVFVMAAFVLLGCEQNKQKKSYTVVRGSRVVTNGSPNNTSPGTSGSGALAIQSGKTYGQITRGNSYQDAFQSALTALLSLQNVTPGYTSGDFSQSTGLYMWGHAELTTGVFNPNNYGGGTLRIRGDSALLELITVDEYANQYGPIRTRVANTDESGNVNSSFQADGYIQGTYAQIAVGDSAGWIILDGNFNSSYYQGTIWFGQATGSMQALGQFTVSTCGFFRCQ